jgi:chemotaxis protein MotB
MAQLKNEHPRPIIVKKIIQESHGGHHGGAWKVAYADFVTAMMAFFMLMWIIGATTEKQRKALADYFSPTLVQSKQDTAGSRGVFGGDALNKIDHYPHAAKQTGSKSLTIPRDAKGGPKEDAIARSNRTLQQQVKIALMQRAAQNKSLQSLGRNVHLTETIDGLRIDLVDEGDFSMFESGTEQLTPRALILLGAVADVVRRVPNTITIRGHTDASPYSSFATMNNWNLSAARAEATRAYLTSHNVSDQRVMRIEGVADRELYNPKNPFDSANRRMSITLGWASVNQN